MINGFSKFLLSINLGMIILVMIGFVYPFALSSASIKERMNSLPISGSNYQGQELPINVWEQQALEGANFLTRVYTINHQEFFVTLLNGAYSRQVMRNPLHCFKGAGWSIENQKKISLNKGYAHLFLIKKDGQEREALLWYSDGNKQYASSFDYWVKAIVHRLSFGLLGSEPILIVVQPLHEQKIDWKQFVQAFPSLLAL